ncbi:MAG: metal ABC transporter permease [Candidatus Krumholzibacteriota bacterium]|nr:metal ABC transporter permease [Candidatus Krumholzibacteriota bacterium]
MTDLLHYEFMRNALMAAVLVGVACGIVGTLIVVRRIVFIAGGIAHAAFGGIGLGYLLGVDPVLTAIPFSILSAAAVGTVGRRDRAGEEAAIGIMWALGMALGVLFIELAPGYAPDLFGFLFGSIIAVPFSDVIVMLCLDAVIIALVLLFYKELLATSFDEEFARLRGIPVRAIRLLVLCLVALSIIVLVRVAGIILVIALLTIPTVIVRQFTLRLDRLILWSTAVAVVLTVAGLLVSAIVDIASGATIVLVLVAAYAISMLVRWLFSLCRRSERSRP